jgi:hypothetical protein
MKLNLLSLLFITLAATTALAANSGATKSNSTKSEMESNLYFQPKASTSSFEVGITSFSSKLDMNSGGFAISEESTGTSYNLSYLFGLSDQMAMGVSISSSNSTYKSTVLGVTSESKSSGMGDLSLTFKAQSPMSGMKLRYGGYLGISPGNAKSSSTTTEGNNYSGGMSLNPYVAMETTGSLRFGAGLSYLYYFTRKTDSAGSPTVTSETTGGGSLSLTPYLETMLGPGTFTGALAYMSYMGSSTTTSGTTTTNDGYSGYAAMAIYAIDLNPSFTVVGNVAYLKLSVPSSSTSSSYEVPSTNVGLLGRLTF